MTVPLLATSSLTKRFGRLTALSEHRITVDTGEIVGVIGPNGSGKSTFFNLVTGFLRPTPASQLDGVSRSSDLAPARIARLGIARTFQGSRLFAGLSVLRERARRGAASPSGPRCSTPCSASPRLRQAERAVTALARNCSS